MILRLLVLSVILGTCKGISYNNKNLKLPRNVNILCLMGVASPSHHIWNRSLMIALANKGYNVTVLTANIDNVSTPGLHYIHMEGLHEHIKNAKVRLISLSIESTVTSLKSFFDYIDEVAKFNLKTDGIQTLLNYPDQFEFDLIIHDFSSGPSLLGFVERFNNPPLMGVTAFGNPPHTKDLTGNPTFPSFVPMYITEFTSKMNFLERSINFFDYFMTEYYRQRSADIQDKFAREIFGSKMRSLRDIEKDSILVLVNNHHSMDYAEPLLPNVIQVGGMHIKNPNQLTNELSDFIETAPEGAVLFSLGTNMKSSRLGEDKITMFLNAFRRLPKYHFLWNIESENLRKVPHNVFIKRWMSQNDILGHQGVKCFITHSGMLSTQEATWHGVPMVGMPFFGDQYANLAKSIEAGVAEKLDFFTLTEDKIVSALTNILENPRYAMNMARRSALFRDRPAHPLDSAIWWTEYVIRHAPSPASRHVAVDLPHIVVHMWDLLIIWGGAGLSVLYFLFRFLDTIILKRWRRNYKSSDENRNRKIK